MPSVEIGLISDTHMPMRYRKIPARIFELLEGVDMVIHAGDIGELWVIDALSRIGPVTAVHGNDETSAARAACPFLQTLSICGHRIVLTHGHYEDRAVEMASRLDDMWWPKLDRLAASARNHGASILISGHTHIPLARQHGDVLLINPGAIAAGGAFSRQAVQSVARLSLQAGQAPVVRHYNVTTGEPFVPDWDPGLGFKAVSRMYEESIADPSLQDLLPWAAQHLVPLIPDRLHSIVLELAHECWDGKREKVHLDDVASRLRDDPRISREARARMREHPSLRPYFD